jgi:enamine deaminase RidA (YjgF/YER057c/UK114 family)
LTNHPTKGTVEPETEAIRGLPGEGEAMSIERRIGELGLELPAVKAPAANYVNAVRTGNLVFLSGNVPVTADGHIPKGKVGADVTTDQAVEHARLVGLHLLAVPKQELGDLDRVRRIVKLLGMVNAVPEYTEHSKVVNGCSDLFVEVFGEKHARSSIGVGSLPFGITVKIEAIVEVE